MTKDELIELINHTVYENEDGDITGEVMNLVLNAIVATIGVEANPEDEATGTLNKIKIGEEVFDVEGGGGTVDPFPTEGSTNPVQSGGMYVILSTMFEDGCLYGGIVRPQDSPTFGDDHRYFYIATTNGRYVNFNNYEVDGYVVVFSWNENTQNWRYVSLCPNGQAFDDLIENKADKVGGATSGNLAGLDSDGNLTDSGKSPSDFATAAQGDKADTAVQPSDLATVATSGSYSDLLNKPTIPAAQVNSDWNANSGVAQILNKPTIPDVSGKADKVGGATNGDFAGLDASGNLTDSGKKASDFATPIPVVDASTIPASMEPNKLYKYGTLSGDTVFPPLATPTDQSRANVYWWKFTTPASTINVQMPSSITIWNGGQAPTIDPSTTYEITVEDGFGTCIKS